MEQPQYLARPTDGSIYFMNEDKTYSSLYMVEQFPENRHHSWSLEHLLSVNFYAVEKKDFARLKDKHDRYYELMKKHSRSDGHGGEYIDEDITLQLIQLEQEK